MVTEFLDPIFQMDALNGLIGTLQPNALTLREDLLKLIPPRAAGRGRTRESFNSRTSVTFDGVSLAETAANLTCRMVFHPARATRLVEYHARDANQPGLAKVLNTVVDKTILTKAPNGLAGEVKRNVDFIVLDHLMSLAVNKDASPAAQSIAMAEVKELTTKINRKRGKLSRDKSHVEMMQYRIKSFLNEPDDYIPVSVPPAPPGSPIGTEFGCTFEIHS